MMPIFWRTPPAVMKAANSSGVAEGERGGVKNDAISPHPRGTAMVNSVPHQTAMR
jgi:hypothetical protein